MRNSQFWRSVDLTGNQTCIPLVASYISFWRSVDLTGNQTYKSVISNGISFGAVSI